MELCERARRAPHRDHARRRRRRGGRHRHPQFLRPGRRRHAGPRPEPEIRPQALLPRRDAALGRRQGAGEGAGDPRRRPQRRAARERRLVAQAAPRRGEPHAGRDRGARDAAPGGRLDRRSAPPHARAGEDLHLVELPRAGLGSLRPRPPARPRLGLARPCRHPALASTWRARRGAGRGRPTTCRSRP